MSEARVWFLNTAEGQAGPYTAEELRSWAAAGQINADWYVWREGLAGWQRLGDTPELSAAPAPPPSAPPPAPVPPAAPAAAAKTEASPAKAEPPKKTETKRRISKGFLVAVVLLLLVGGGGYALFAFAPDLVDPLLIKIGLKAPPPPPVEAPIDLEGKTPADIAAENGAKKAVRRLAQAKTLPDVFAQLEAPTAARFSLELLVLADTTARGSDSTALKKAGTEFLARYEINISKETDAEVLWSRLEENRDTFLVDLDALFERLRPLLDSAPLPAPLTWGDVDAAELEYTVEDPKRVVVADPTDTQRTCIAILTEGEGWKIRFDAD